MSKLTYNLIETEYGCDYEWKIVYKDGTILDPINYSFWNGDTYSVIRSMRSDGSAYVSDRLHGSLVYSAKEYLLSKYDLQRALKNEN